MRRGDVWTVARGKDYAGKAGTRNIFSSGNGQPND
jgi:hypothetical protein